MKARIVGKHILGTLVNCNKEVLINYDLLYNFLNSFPPKIGMRKIEFPDGTNPFIKECDGGNTPNGDGISGVVLLHTSHFSIHVWPHYNEVDFDVFSCDDFNAEQVVDILKDFFGGESLDLTLITRGREHKVEQI